MKRRSKIFVSLLFLGVAAFTIVIIEETLRTRSVHAFEIRGLPIKNVEATGAWKPDFLWIGKAWWIEIDSDQPVSLILDDWTGEIPAGSHKIYSNHNHTNTGQFSSIEFWRFPESVEIRPIQKQR